MENKEKDILTKTEAEQPLEEGMETLPSVKESPEKVAEEKISQVETTAESAVQSGESAFDRIKEASALSSEKVAEIESRGGFRVRLEDIAERIQSLAARTKERIAAMMGTSEKAQEPNVEQVREEKETATEQGAEETTLESVEEIPQEKFEQEISPEELELKEYIEKEVYTELGISEEDKERALQEVAPDRRELFERSFQNIRDTVEAYYVMETQKGRFDYANYKIEKERRESKEIYPWVKQQLEEKGFSEQDLEKASILPENVPIQDLQYIADNLLNEKRKEIKEQAEQEIYNALEKEGRWDDINLPTPQQAEDEDFMEDYFKKVKQAVWKESRQRSEGAGWSKNWTYGFGQEAVMLRENIPMLDMKPFTHTRERGEVLPELREELQNVENSRFLCVNVSPEKLKKVVAEGAYKGIFSLDEESVRDQAKFLSLDADLYLKQRELSEQELGIYDAKSAVVYGTLGSRNGIDERYGGGRSFGSIFLKLKSSVEDRTSYSEGDSLTPIGLTGAVIEKLDRQGVRGRDIFSDKRFATARQISPEHASLAKAITNIELKREEENRKGLAKQDSFIEAHIRGGFSSDEIESINVPKEAFEAGMRGYGDRATYQYIQQLQQDSQWRDKVNIID